MTSRACPSERARQRRDRLCNDWSKWRTPFGPDPAGSSTIVEHPRVAHRAPAREVWGGSPVIRGAPSPPASWSSEHDSSAITCVAHGGEGARSFVRTVVVQAGHRPRVELGREASHRQRARCPRGSARCGTAPRPANLRPRVKAPGLRAAGLRPRRPEVEHVGAPTGTEAGSSLPLPWLCPPFRRDPSRRTLFGDLLGHGSWPDRGHLCAVAGRARDLPLVTSYSVLLVLVVVHVRSTREARRRSGEKHGAERRSGRAIVADGPSAKARRFL